MTRSAVESHQRYARWAGQLVCGLAAVTALIAVAPAAQAQVTAYPSVPAPLPNPELQGKCGELKVMLVLDESGSIANAGATGRVRSAAIAFVEAIADTGTQLAITSFSTKARNGVVPYREVTSGTSGNLSTFTNWINNTNVNNTGYNPTGGTNWEDGLLQVDRVTGGPPDLVVFVTDGDPTYYNTSATTVGGPGNAFDQTALNRAVTVANAQEAAVPVADRAGRIAHIRGRCRGRGTTG